jgi:LPS-assembly lipoprotein
MKPYRFLSGILAFTLLLSGCGFHLRGLIDMPRWLNHVSVIIERAQRDIRPALTEYLQSYDIIVESSPAQAKYWLIVQQDNLQEQIASVSSSATPRQYELTYTVTFKLVEAKGREIMPPSAISVTRQATINSNRILGSTQEEALLIKEMRREAATQIVYKLSMALSKYGKQKD